MSQYIITDGFRFIYQNYAGKYVPTSSEAMADIFTKKQAEAVYHNAMPKALRMVFHIEKYDVVPEGVKRVNQHDLLKNTERVMETDNIQVWINKISNLNGISKDAIKRKEILEKELKDLEDEKMDIEHYIEFQNLNASQGYKASRELKICRMKRRTVKNELAVINIILSPKVKEMITDEIYHKIQELDNRTYKPRVRTDLFDL